MQINKFWVDSKNSVPPETLYNLKQTYPQLIEKNLGDHSGDILVEMEEKTVLFEVKSSANDFLDFDRLFNQAEGMRKITPWCFLLHPDFKFDQNGALMGLWKDGYGKHSTYTRNHIVGALRRVQAHGVICEPVVNGLVRTIGVVLGWVDGADKGTITTETIKLSPFDDSDQLTVNLLAWFEGIGVIQAKNFIKWCNEKGIKGRMNILNRALVEFEGSDKPTGWTNYTIQRNRKQMQLDAPVKPKTEWEEELDA